MRSRSVAAVIPWVWAGLMVLLTVVVALQMMMSDAITVALVVVPMSFLAAFLAARRPGNGISWLLFWMAAGLLLQTGLEGWASVPFASPTFFDFALLHLVNVTGVFVFLPLALILLLFPTGHFLNRRWALAGWFAGTLLCSYVVVGLFVPEIGPVYADWTIDNPIGFLPAWTSGVVDAVGTLGFFLPLLGVLSTALRFRRAEAVERAQLKWLFYAAIVWPPLYAMAALSTESTLAFGIGFLTPQLLIPIAITIAILKYRLFEIDRIISRTLGYALVVAGLGALYVVGAVWLPTHLVGERPPLFVAGSTLVVAALFNPVRRRAIAWVDRRFYRSQYDAQRVIDRFGERLRDELDVDQLRSESSQAVVATMQPASLSVWLPDRSAR